VSARRALVLGATGHIGQAIVRELLAHGWQVTAASRQRRPAALAGLAVDAVIGDAAAPGTLERWVPGHEAVFDAAAPYPLHLFRRTPDDAPAVAERRTAALVAACGRAGALLAHVSSQATLPPPAGAGPLARLETPLRRRLHPYFAAKAAMERQVLGAAAQGLPALVLNPGACLGPWDRRERALCVVPLLACGEVPVLASHPLNVIDVRDLARAARLAVEQRRTGRRIPLAGHDSRTEQLAAAVCRLAGVAPPPQRWPARLAFGAMLASEAGFALLGRAPLVPALGTLLLLDGGPMAPGDDQRAMGVVPRPLDETLADALAWYRALGYC
jgi:dihydroflavonol-4-reductase